MVAHTLGNTFDLGTIKELTGIERSGSSDRQPPRLAGCFGSGAALTVQFQL
ncbi:hypothetical protein D3C83_304280 [compost metagenome]